MRIIHKLLSYLILFLDKVTSPRGVQRNPETQAAIDVQTASLTLYQFQACPFCVRVRRYLKRQSLVIETKDANRSDQSRAELLAGGGKWQVPCLRIEDGQGQVSWMYESKDIIGYLEGRFVAG